MGSMNIRGLVGALLGAIAPAPAAVAGASSPIVNERVFGTSAEEIWRLWTTEQGVTEWLCNGANIELREGGAYEIFFDMSKPAGERGSEGCRIIEFEPMELLSVGWNAPPHLPSVRDERTRVDVELKPLAADITRVRITHRGWPDDPPAHLEEEWAQAHQYFEHAWGYVVNALDTRLRGETRSLTHSTALRAPVEDVWAAFTTKEGVESWMVPLAQVDLRVGGYLKTNYNPEGSIGDPGTIEHRILSYEPMRMLSTRIADSPEGEPLFELCHDLWSVMHFEPLGRHHTRFTITGHGYGDSGAWVRLHEFFEQGNAYTLQQLRERFPVEPELSDARAMETMRRFLGGEWIHESETEQGVFRVRNVVTKAADGKSLAFNGFLGIGAGMSDHNDSLVWRDPASGRVVFRAINHDGSSAQGSIVLIEPETLEWDWRSTDADGEESIFRLLTRFDGADRYEMKLFANAAEGPGRLMLTADFRRVDQAPERFSPMGTDADRARSE